MVESFNDYSDRDDAAEFTTSSFEPMFNLDDPFYSN